MPMHAASYFAGVGTVVATTLLGFGGGVLMTDAFVGKSENPPTLVERRASPMSESTPAVAAAPNPTAPASQPLAEAPRPAAPQPVAAAQTPTPSTRPAAASAGVTAPIAAPPADAAPVQASVPASPVAQRPRQVDNAMAMTREDDVKKALAAERRKDERRKWAAQRKREMKKIDELNAMAEKVKEAEREREPATRSFAVQSPVIRLFGDD